MRRAFVLGAGLGTRLRPLTNFLPKPLIPVWHRPLMAFAMDHLMTLGVREFVVNTHHLPEAYTAAFPGHSYHGCPIHFRHEPVLLETGGGLANVRDLLDHGESFAVYNGDILTDIDLAPALEMHHAMENMVTLLLREGGAVQNVAFDAATGSVLDLRNALRTNYPKQYQFTGVYFVHPGFFDYLHAGKIESVVEGFLRAITAGQKIGGCIVKGDWWDLGDHASYLEAHAAVKQGPFPRYQTETPWKSSLAPDAILENGTQIDALSCVAAGARIGAGAKLEECLVWPNAIVPPGTLAHRQIFPAAATKQPPHFAVSG